MPKLPKSSRPKTRKPSETFSPPYQRDVFAPPLASSMSEVGAVARIVVGAFVPLILAYLTVSNGLPDDSIVKRAHYEHAAILTGLFAAFGLVEFMRTMRVLDTEKLGRFPRYALVTITLISAV